MASGVPAARACASALAAPRSPPPPQRPSAAASPAAAAPAREQKQPRALNLGDHQHIVAARVRAGVSSAYAVNSLLASSRLRGRAELAAAIPNHTPAR
eukprot:6175068-Pleurochrysis_carterae.AAC.2